MIIFDLFEDANKKPQGVTEGALNEFAPGDRDDGGDLPPEIHTLANRWWNATDDQPMITNVLRSMGWSIAQVESEDDAVQLQYRDGTTYFVSADEFDPDLFEQGISEGQYEIHHLDPEGRRKAIYHHGKGYTDDVVRKDTQYHQERNPRDTFRVFKDKQPFDWQGMAPGSLKEFAPVGGDNDGDDGFSEETLKQLAAQWYNGNEDPEVERTLEVAGWEIGQVEDDDEPGVFVVLAGDINGNSYIQWTEDELRQGVAEAEGPGRVDPILYKALARMTKGGYDDAKIALAIEFGLLDMKHNYAIANNYIPKLVDLYNQKHGVAEGALTEMNRRGFLKGLAGFAASAAAPTPILKLLSTPAGISSLSTPAGVTTLGMTAGLALLKGIKAQLDQYDPEDDDAYFEAWEDMAAELGFDSTDADGEYIDPLGDLINLYNENPKKAAQQLITHIQSEAVNPDDITSTFRPRDDWRKRDELNDPEDDSKPYDYYASNTPEKNKIVIYTTDFDGNIMDTYIRDNRQSDPVEELKKFIRSDGSSSGSRFYKYTKYSATNGGKPVKIDNEKYIDPSKLSNALSPDQVREKMYKMWDADIDPNVATVSTTPGALARAATIAKAGIDKLSNLRNKTQPVPTVKDMGPIQRVKPAPALPAPTTEPELNVAPNLKQKVKTGVAESLDDHERYQYIVTLKSGKRIRFLCGADCDVKTYIERKYNEPVVDIKDQGIVGEPPVELLPGEMKRDELKELAPTQKNTSDQEGKISAELRKLRAQYPDARSDLEAVAIGGMEAHDDARKHLARVDTIVSKLDRAADQLQSVNTDQDSELNDLDRENNDLEQKIKDLEQKIGKTSQPRTKAADMPAQARQDKQAKQDNTPQDAAPVAQRKPTTEPAAPAQSKQEPADKGVGLGHVAAQLKDLPSTINIGKKSVPDQLPPNVSKINFDPDFGPAIARRGNLDEESGVNPYQENDINLGAYNLTQTGSAWESRVPSITLQFGPNKSLRMSRPQLFAIMAILSSTDVEQDQQQQAATERVRAFKKILSSRDRTIAWLQHPEVQTFVASYPAWQAHQEAKNKNQQQKDLLAPQEPVQQELFRESTPVTEVSPEYIERYKKEHGRRATAADQAGDYAKGHEHFKKINKLTKQQFQRAQPEKVDEISNFMTQPTEPVTPEEQWKRRIRLLAKQYQTNASSLAALARENGPDSAEAVAYEYLRDPSKIRVPGTAAPASAVNWDEVIRRLPMGLSGMALLQAAEEYLINNKGMLRSTVRSLLNNDENQRSLSAAYAKKNTTSESVTENNEVVEQAISRRIMVGRKDLLLKYGPRRVMEAVEQVADHVGAVDEIGSSDVSGWIRQVERVLA